MRDGTSTKKMTEYFFFLSACIGLTLSLIGLWATAEGTPFTGLARSVAAGTVLPWSLPNCPAMTADLCGFFPWSDGLGEAARFSFPVHPHMLRHACGYKLANDGRDTRAL